MKTLKFKTNLKCSGCVAAVQPNLDAIENIKWDVDLSSADKTLTIEGEADEKEIEKAFEKAGYKAELQG